MVSIQLTVSFEPACTTVGVDVRGAPQGPVLFAS